VGEVYMKVRKKSIRMIRSGELLNRSVAAFLCITILALDVVGIGIWLTPTPALAAISSTAMRPASVSIAKQPMVVIPGRLQSLSIVKQTVMVWRSGMTDGLPMTPVQIFIS
jgi:hypothetical protein